MSSASLVPLSVPLRLLEVPSPNDISHSPDDISAAQLLTGLATGLCHPVPAQRAQAGLSGPLAAPQSSVTGPSWESGRARDELPHWTQVDPGPVGEGPEEYKAQEEEEEEAEEAEEAEEGSEDEQEKEDGMSEEETSEDDAKEKMRKALDIHDKARYTGTCPYVYLFES